MEKHFKNDAASWQALYTAAADGARNEPLLTQQLQSQILSAQNFGEALARILAFELQRTESDTPKFIESFEKIYREQPQLLTAAADDLSAVLERDPAAAQQILVPFIFFKGFHALQAYRLAHYFWQQERRLLAYELQARMARQFAIDIHPAAKLGQGIMLDHAHGLVIGETAVVEDNVSMLHNVTLGGTGKESGDRHPKIRRGVMIGAGAKILGNIEVGAGARIAAGSVVLKPVPAGVTVAGVPARIVGDAGSAMPATAMDQLVLTES